MRAIQVVQAGSGFELTTRTIPEPGENEVLIKVEACGICHGDVLALDGHFPGTSYPRIPGHEVIGIVEQSGAKAAYWKKGQRVGVGWHGGHCNACEACQKGAFQSCTRTLVTGLSLDGGYAEYMVARPEAIVSIPDGLDPVVGAPLLCAGRTTFGALQSSLAKGGDLVAIHGMGGLGHLAVQYARKLGFRTVVLSRGQDKEALALKLGANAYIDTSKVDGAKELQKLGGAKVLLCTAPNGPAISALIPGLAHGGEAIIVAGTSEMLQISPFLLLAGERSIRGFVGGTLEETIRFSVLCDVHPMVEVFPLEEAVAAFGKMMASKVHFRAVLKMNP
jgi:D-arabinose 1-dehydrogenase-like Zn-dependent alcohol dehydrogenase